MLIRDLVPEDTDLLFALIGPDDLNMVSPPTRETMARFMEFFLRSTSLTSVAEVDGALVGQAQVRFNANGATAELSYATSKRHRERGVATRLAQDAIRRARLRTPAVEIWAKVAERNPASIRVLEKLGFEPAATTDPAFFSGKLKDEDRFYRLPARPRPTYL
ncbi:MAG: GNAT family N-acetyltransferase [Planctomycetes bacterium]|nr:GNAT family N-acetyltransferase [Planctomycetota bacterium]